MSYKKCIQCDQLDSDCECQNPDIKEHDSNGDRTDQYKKQDTMDRDYPEYSQKERNAGRFLGLDHPYVPGDF